MDSINKNQTDGQVNEATNGHSKVGQTSVLEPVPAKALEQVLRAPQTSEPESSDQSVAEPAADPAAPASGKTAAPRKNSVKKIALATALGVGAIAAGTFGYRWWQFSSTHETTDNATVSGHVYQISSRIPGTVKTVPVDDNQAVKPGQLLVQLDPRDYQMKVQQAQAAIAVAQRQAEAAQNTVTLAGANTQANTTEAQGNLSSAVASIATAQAAVNEAQSGVPAARAQLAQAEADLQKVQADYARYQSLYQEGAVAQQQLDSARAAYNVAVA
ncbi:MAG TPA: biotin/lipoyl-binding protein, partial [Coleofasciculaceae cyanobacterium]